MCCLTKMTNSIHLQNVTIKLFEKNGTAACFIESLRNCETRICLLPNECLILADNLEIIEFIIEQHKHLEEGGYLYVKKVKLESFDELRFRLESDGVCQLFIYKSSLDTCNIFHGFSITHSEIPCVKDFLIKHFKPNIC